MIWHCICVCVHNMLVSFVQYAIDGLEVVEGYLSIVVDLTKQVKLSLFYPRFSGGVVMYVCMYVCVCVREREREERRGLETASSMSVHCLTSGDYYNNYMLMLFLIRL